jgi:beta-lactamase regulating signal transducer with metallopeptidase domain
MRTISQLLLTFLLNACWQIALVAALASLSSWLLRNSAARNRHWIWVAALLLSLGIPFTTSSRILSEAWTSTPFVQTTNIYQGEIPPFALGETRAVAFTQPLLSQDAFLMNRVVAFALMMTYCAFLFYGAIRLARAFYATRQLRKNSLEVRENERIAALIERCSACISETAKTASVCTSETVPVPITIGIFSPVIIVPHQLLSETNDEVLTSAIGHELIHVQRRDYALNLAYELCYLLISFHPAASLIRRRIRQTRELSCDELVAERILNAEVYARSLVQLASSAPALRGLSISTTVGIADADILEVRVMSLLKGQKMNSRWRRSLLAVVALLLVIPSIAAASFAMRFDVDQMQASMSQEQEQKEKEKIEKEKTKERRESREFAVGYAAGQAEQERKKELDGDLVTVRLRHQEEELKTRDVMRVALVRLARVSMDQAIQIATSQYPGKVLECSLNGEHWEEPGKLAKDGRVFYHVVILAGDESDVGTTHVLVNAIDGTIIKTEKELPRKMRSPEPQ